MQAITSARRMSELYRLSRDTHDEQTCNR
jgi:hypothetical protein